MIGCRRQFRRIVKLDERAYAEAVEIDWWLLVELLRRSLG